MKCPICRFGETTLGTATVTLTRGSAIMVIRHVPAEVCDSCGADYTDEAATRRLNQLLDEACAAGIELDVREYSAA